MKMLNCSFVFGLCLVIAYFGAAFLNNCYDWLADMESPFQTNLFDFGLDSVFWFYCAATSFATIAFLELVTYAPQKKGELQSKFFVIFAITMALAGVALTPIGMNLSIALCQSLSLDNFASKIYENRNFAKGAALAGFFLTLLIKIMWGLHKLWYPDEEEDEPNLKTPS